MIGEEVKARMREIAAQYPQARSAMLPCLHLAQEAEGYVTPAAVQTVAEVIGVKPDEVESVVSFYSMYSQHPRGQHVIKVCTSISCYLRGCDDLLAHLEERLGIARGETSADGLFTLEPVECLAACGMAPVLQVNSAFVENVTTEMADDLIARLRQGEQTLHNSWRVIGDGAGMASVTTMATPPHEGASAQGGAGAAAGGAAAPSARATED